ncbi:MAG: ATP-binding protein [Candidatus Binatia bacterium]
MQRVERVLERVSELPNSPVGRHAPNRLVQVLMPLLDNAAKFTDEEKIFLAARLDQKHLEVAIADTGNGIDVEQQEIIFEGFR